MPDATLLLLLTPTQTEMTGKPFTLFSGRGLGDSQSGMMIPTLLQDGSLV